MNTFAKCFIGLFGLLGAFLLFCALIRLSNGKSAFISLSDINLYFSQIDIYKPFKDFSDAFTKLKNEFFDDVQNLQLWNYPIESVSDFFMSIFNFTRWLGTIIFDIMKLLGLPFYAIYTFIDFLVSLLSAFFGFTTNLLL